MNVKKIYTGLTLTQSENNIIKKASELDKRSRLSYIRITVLEKAKQDIQKHTQSLEGMNFSKNQKPTSQTYSSHPLETPPT